MIVVRIRSFMTIYYRAGRWNWVQYAETGMQANGRSVYILYTGGQRGKHNRICMRVHSPSVTHVYIPYVTMEGRHIAHIHFHTSLMSTVGVNDARSPLVPVKSKMYINFPCKHLWKHNINDLKIQHFLKWQRETLFKSIYQPRSVFGWGTQMMVVEEGAYVLHLARRWKIGRFPPEW